MPITPHMVWQNRHSRGICPLTHHTRYPVSRVATFPVKNLSRVSAWVKENLPRAKEQGAESAEQHRRRQNDAKAHTGNQVYSCGSLAPKLKKGGCSDCQVCAHVNDGRWRTNCCRMECATMG